MQYIRFHPQKLKILLPVICMIMVMGYRLSVLTLHLRIISACKISKVQPSQLPTTAPSLTPSPLAGRPMRVGRRHAVPIPRRRRPRIGVVRWGPRVWVVWWRPGIGVMRRRRPVRRGGPIGVIIVRVMWRRHVVGWRQATWVVRRRPAARGRGPPIWPWPWRGWAPASHAKDLGNFHTVGTCGQSASLQLPCDMGHGSGAEVAVHDHVHDCLYWHRRALNGLCSSDRGHTDQRWVQQGGRPGAGAANKHAVARETMIMRMHTTCKGEMKQGA